MSVVCALGSHTVHQLLDTRFCFSSNRRLSRVRTCSFSVPHWRQSEGRSLTIPSQGLPARDSLREHSQLRRGGYLLQSNGRKRLDSHIQNARRSDRKDREEGLRSSLYVRFEKLPPDGKSVLDEEALCNPEERRCKTPIHVWEKKCEACYGSGSVSRSSRRGHRQLYTCLACHGLGYVRHASSSEIPDLQNGAITVGRENAEDGDGKQ